jgi:predicted PurR-regulated permease PerM
MNLTRPQLVWIAALAAIVAAVVVLREILLPFVAAIALAYLLDPIVDRFERIGVNRSVAALGIIVLFYLALAGALALAIPVVGSELATLIDKLPDYIAQLQALAADPKRPWLRKIVGEGLLEAEQSAGELTTMAADWIPSVLRSVWSDTRAVISIFSLLIVTPIVTFYLLKGWKDLIAAIDRSIPVAERETVRTLAGRLDDTIAGFLRGQGTICLILAVYYAVALWLTGLNHGILIGLAAGLISFIPYLGMLTGLVVSLFVVVLQFWPSWTLIPIVLAIFVVGQGIADYVLAPFLIAERIHLGPVEVMFAIAAFGYLFGVVGLLIAVPLAAAIGVLVRFAAQHYPAVPPGPAAEPAPLASADAPPPSRKSWLRSLLGS